VTKRKCPAATGVPIDEKRCIVSGLNHRCMHEATFHFAHLCMCGTGWMSETTTIDEIQGKRADT
jgi:hypothetical protein